MRWVFSFLILLFLCSEAIARKRAGYCPAKSNNCAQRCAMMNRRNMRCGCFRGFYRPGRNRKDCLDVNECASRNGGCQHICTNIPGSYHCSCRPGFVLASNMRKCIRPRPSAICSSDSLQCAHFCTVTSTGPSCKCRRGYRLASDGRNCIRLCIYGNGGCHHTCNKELQRTYCTCKRDFILQADQRTCAVAPSSCDVNQGGCSDKCEETPVGVQCSCLSGFALKSDRRSCIDIDECAKNNGDCESGCKNSQGSYVCTCLRGFKLASDERSCIDIDECQLNDTCWGRCVNSLGSYECTCYKGFQKYAVKRCGDINECLVNNGGCAHNCINETGGFECTCNNGYELHWNRKDCVRKSRCVRSRGVNPIAAYYNCQRGGCTLKCNVESFFRAYVVSRASYRYTCGRVPTLPRRSTRKPTPVTFRPLWETPNLIANDTLPECTDLNMQKYHTRFNIKVDHCHLLNTNLTKIVSSKSSRRSIVRINWIIISCQAINRRRKARLSVEVEMIFSPLRGCSARCLQKKLKKLGKRTSVSIKRSIRKRLFHLSVSSTLLQIRKKGSVKRKIVPGIRTRAGCLLGFARVSRREMCKMCEPGTFYNVSGASCDSCKIGTFQDKYGQLGCKPCPRSRQRAEGVQSASMVSQCPGICRAGYFSFNGLEPCQPCPRGSYQPERGRTGCYQCGSRMTTRALGVETFLGCSVRAVCTSGHFYNVRTASCGRCPIGFYQPNVGQRFCYPCPGNATTDYDASDSVEDCKDQRCGGVIGDLHGFIESPNYPGEYPINSHCEWVIHPPKKRNLLIIIPEIFLPGLDCEDYLIMSKKSINSGSSSSTATYESCQTLENPLAFTVGSKKLWIEFRSDDNTGGKGFQIPYVTYDENYEEIIQDIVRDPRLSSPYYHQNILKDKKSRETLFDVLANPEMYFNIRNQLNDDLFPGSFVDFLRQKVVKFFSH